jgi:hypothetical protein
VARILPALDWIAGAQGLHRVRHGFRFESGLVPVRRYRIRRLGEAADDSNAHAKEAGWARDLNISYTPSILFFDAQGTEVFRIEAYVRPFHLASGFDYVVSGAYREEPSFQRYVQARADKIRGAGGRIELW